MRNLATKWLSLRLWYVLKTRFYPGFATKQVSRFQGSSSHFGFWSRQKTRQHDASLQDPGFLCHPTVTAVVNLFHSSSKCYCGLKPTVFNPTFTAVLNPTAISHHPSLMQFLHGFSDGLWSQSPSGILDLFLLTMASFSTAMAGRSGSLGRKIWSQGAQGSSVAAASLMILENYDLINDWIQWEYDTWNVWIKFLIGWEYGLL